MIALSRTLYRNRHEAPVAVWIVVACSGLSGLIVTWTIMGLASLVGLDTGFGSLDQLVVIWLLCAYGSCMLILLFDYRDRTATARAALIEEAVQLEVEAMQRTTIVAQLQAQLDADVAAELGGVRTTLESRLQFARDAEGIDQSSDRPDWSEISALLRETAQSSVRPLSARMWQQAAQDYPRRSGWVIIPNIVSGQPFRPLVIIVIHALTGLKDVTALFGPERGVTLMAAQCLAILGFCGPANALMRRFPSQHSRIFIGALVLLQSGVIATSICRESWVPGSAPPSWAIAQMIVGTALVLITSGFGAWRQFDVSSRDLFRDRVRRNRVASMARSRQLADLARQASRLLHGSVQTRLHSCAMAIDGAGAAEDERARIEALLEAMAILDQPLKKARSAGSIGEEVQRKVALWGSLCEFTIDIQLDSHSDVDATDSPSESIGRIVEEGISNAIRHGKATRIDIVVSTRPDGTCDVAITDNGTGPLGGKPGVGSALLHQSSAGAWSLIALDRGSRLVVAVRS
jgi:signal transduction histidine kinase